MAFELPTLPYSTTALAGERHVPGNPGAASRQAPSGLCHGAERLRREERRRCRASRSTRSSSCRTASADLAPVFNNAGQHWNHILFWQCMSPTGGKHSRQAGEEDHRRLRRRGAVQGRVQGRRRRPVRLRLGLAGARLRRQAEGDARRRTAPTRWPPARARCCSAATCGSTATTSTSATAARTTCRTGSTSSRTTNTPRRS